MLVITVTRDVVYNKATDDFTVSVKDLKKDIVMDGERSVYRRFYFETQRFPDHNLSNSTYLHYMMF